MGRPLLFALNGERVEVKEVDPQLTLLSFIRSKTRLRGPKLGCGEGGCGACVVLLSRYDRVTKKVRESTINSCLALLCSIDGCAITTTEGIKPSGGKDFHAVHKRLAGFHGSQCGFCTPGMAISIYSCLRNASTPHDKPNADRLSHSTLPNLSTAEVERSISGNICRCTGYRPILDTCKSFAGDVDVEDLGINTFWNASKDARLGLLPPYNPEDDPKFPSFLIEELEGRTGEESTLHIEHVEGHEKIEERQYRTTASLSELFSLIDEYKGKKVKLVVGNTSAGIYKNLKPEVYLDISHIPELRSIQGTPDTLEVGAALPIADLVDILEGKLKVPSGDVCIALGGLVYAGLAMHLRQLASGHIRNRASVGGNLIMAQQLSFDSDLATILLGAGASVTIFSSQRGKSVLPLDVFLENGNLDANSVLLSVSIPSWNQTRSAFFKTYRAAPRPLGNAVSHINAAFLANVERVGDKKGYVVKDLRLAFGAFGGEHAILAAKTEAIIVGKQITPALLLEAVKVLRTELTPTHEVSHAEYRSSVAVGFLFDFFKQFLLTGASENFASGSNGVHQDKDCVENEVANGDAHSNGVHQDEDHVESGVANGDAQTNGVHQNGSGVIEFGNGSASLKALSSGQQKFGRAGKAFHPVQQPLAKIAAELQASGEAVYVDDIPSQDGTLNAAFVTSQQAYAKITKVDPSQALACPGVVSFMDHKDIPGKNVGLPDYVFYQSELLFAEDTVQFYGQPLGIIVADTYEHAKEAAAKVEVTYDTNTLGPPILTIEDAVARDSYIPLGMFKDYAKKSVSNVEGIKKGIHRIESAEVTCGSQYFFYMETQVSYAVPDEDGGLIVYSACQGPEITQLCVHLATGVDMSNARVISRRMGGAFGGKASRSIPIAVACAVAAVNLKRPVRMSLDRNTDMLISGGRHHTKAVYTVDFNDDGKITSLDLDVFVNAGWSPDLSPAMATTMSGTLCSYNWGSLKLEIKVCKSNLASKSSMRAPGELQACFIAESIIEHVAAYLGISAEQVREKNFHSQESVTSFLGAKALGGPEDFTLRLIWDSVKESSRFNKRQLDVESFNAKNKWVKKGIAMTPCWYHIGSMTKSARVSAFMDGSIAVEVGGTEMGQGLYTKVRQAVAYGLNKLWGENLQHPAEGVDLSKIRIIQHDSISLANGGLTGGSSTSEGSCAAVLLACHELVNSFQPALQTLRKSGMYPVPFETIVATAKLTGAALTGHGASDNSLQYLSFGACVSEVEVDVLTGATTILQTDLLHDCGRSLNPAVDIGQVEGAFVQGIGFYVTEELVLDDKGILVTDGTWTYKPPTFDNVPKQFKVELLNKPGSEKFILSSKASGEPPLLLAKSVHSAIRNAIMAARKDLAEVESHSSTVPTKHSGSNSWFRLNSPATMEYVKEVIGYNNVEILLTAMS